MSEIQPDQNNNNNNNDNKKEEIEPKEEKSEEELMKEIQETKRKLYQLYGQQWKLKVQKYKEWKEQQSQKNPDSDDDNNNNNNNDNKNDCGQRKPCHQWGCHGWRCGEWDQCSPYYRWWQCSQQQPQSSWGGCEQRRCCQHQFKCEKKNDEESKPNQNAQKECPRRCHPHHHCRPSWMWYYWAQKRKQMQQEQWQCQSQCPNWGKCEKPEQCSKPCQSPCGECPRRHHRCHRFSPGACWWFWAQRQRQMQQQQQQENPCSKWWPCEGRRCCMTSNQSPCAECPRRHHCHQHCPPQWKWWFWAQRQRQMQMQQQQWPNFWGCGMQSQWPQRCLSPCGDWQRRCRCSPGFSPAWLWWIRAERQRQMRRRWLRWFMWKKYMMHCRSQCGKKPDEKQDNDQKVMRCCHRFKCCRKSGCCQINKQKENDKKEDENQKQDSQQVFEEEEEN